MDTLCLVPVFSVGVYVAFERLRLKVDIWNYQVTSGRPWKAPADIMITWNCRDCLQLRLVLLNQSNLANPWSCEYKIESVVLRDGLKQLLC
jgi:hypothetical protein